MSKKAFPTRSRDLLVRKTLQLQLEDGQVMHGTKESRTEDREARQDRREVFAVIGDEAAQHLAEIRRLLSESRDPKVDIRRLRVATNLVRSAALHNRTRLEALRLTT